jgi:hypothetical protein
VVTAPFDSVWCVLACNVFNDAMSSRNDMTSSYQITVVHNDRELESLLDAPTIYNFKSKH